MASPWVRGCGLARNSQDRVSVLYQLSIQTYDRTSGSRGRHFRRPAPRPTPARRQKALRTQKCGRSHGFLRVVRSRAADQGGGSAADQLGATRDGGRTAEDLAAYQRAFAAIDGDRSHLLVVMEAEAEAV